MQWRRILRRIKGNGHPNGMTAVIIVKKWRSRPSRPNLAKILVSINRPQIKSSILQNV